MARNGLKSREFTFSQKDFDFISALIKQKAGIVLNNKKQNMVYGRLSRRLRVLNMASFSEYCDLIASPSGGDEFLTFLNALTTNLTRFFREAHHFDHLADTVLPAKIKQAETSGNRRIRIWSAGSSSGEEPYSTGMVMLDRIKDIDRWDARILATDIDTNMLKRCRKGIYSAEKLEAVPKHLRHKFAKPCSPGGENYQMSGEIRSLITFKTLNLLGTWPMKGPFDVIFCRNVIIYFDKPTQKQIIERYADLLCKGGFLYVGHSESLFNVTKRFILIGQSIYQKVD